MRLDFHFPDMGEKYQTISDVADNTYRGLQTHFRVLLLHHRLVMLC